MIFSKLYDKRKKQILKELKIKTAKKILFGTVAGSFSGLISGLLFSPKSGKETRKDIVTSSIELTNNIKEKNIGLKEVIDNKVKIFEYLNGDKPFKRNLCTKEILTDDSK